MPLCNSSFLKEKSSSVYSVTKILQIFVKELNYLLLSSIVILVLQRLLPALELPMDNEANTEDRVILPLLERWGYQSSEYQAKPRLKEGYPDFLVTLPRVGDRPLNYLIIEVKTPSKSPLTGSQQLRRYMEAAHAVFGLLTNGREYQLFYQNPLKAPLQQVRCASGLLDKETLQRLSKIFAPLHSVCFGGCFNPSTARNLSSF